MVAAGALALTAATLLAGCGGPSTASTAAPAESEAPMSEAAVAEVPAGSTTASTATSAAAPAQASSQPAAAPSAAVKESGQTTKGAFSGMGDGKSCNAVITRLPAPGVQGAAGLGTLDFAQQTLFFRESDPMPWMDGLQVGQRVRLMSNRGVVTGNGSAGKFMVDCI